MGKVFAVGVGPGSPKYVTEIVKEIVQNCDIVIGYKYTLKTIEDLLEGKEIHEITMNNQEESYQEVPRLFLMCTCTQSQYHNFELSL